MGEQEPPSASNAGQPFEEPLGHRRMGFVEEEGFLCKTLPDGTRIGLLPGRLRYHDAINPENWVEQRILTGTRSGHVVESRLEGEPVILVARPQRSEEEVVARRFKLEMFPPDVRLNLKKAQFMHDQIRYEDDEIVVGYEIPIGFVERPGRRPEEVYVGYPAAHDKDLYLMEENPPGAEERVGRCIDKFNELHHRHPTHSFLEHDGFSEEFDFIFQNDDRGRTVLIKYDTEFMEIEKKQF